jgi:hypothetical protein
MARRPRSLKQKDQAEKKSQEAEKTDEDEESGEEEEEQEKEEVCEQEEEAQEVSSISGDELESLPVASARSFSRIFNQVDQVEKRQASMWESIKSTLAWSGSSLFPKHPTSRLDG